VSHNIGGGDIWPGRRCSAASSGIESRQEEGVVTFKAAFFAFPNQPEELRGPIVAAAELVKANPNVSVRTWPQMEVFGAAIPDEVKGGIEKADVLVCDITRANLNVYYEIGYSIGLGKTIAPVLNVSFVNAVADIEKGGLFDVIGYQVYENSRALADILGNLPSTALLDLYAKSLNNHQPLYFLNAYRKTDFVNAIAAAIKDSRVFYRSFDPAESARFSIFNAINDLTSSAGAVIPFLESYVDDWERHNIRAAFLAGLAHGLEREVLLIRHNAANSQPAALDYRNDVVGVRSASEVTEKVASFCGRVLIAAQSIRPPTGRASTSALQRLTLGATAAENEFRTLEDYFVETSEFLRTARGEVGIVAGRKGSGKTAIFFMVRDNFRKQNNSIVSDLRPESHQLSLFKGELAKILEAGAFDHTVAAFWYFVVVTEVLLSLKKDIEFQARRRSELFDDAREIDRTLDKLGVSESGDFTARINRLGSYVTEEIKALVHKGEILSPEKLTNVVFRGGVAEARRLVVKHSAKCEFLVFLFDNIDKGWATDGVDELDVKLVRLLLEALEKVKRDLAVDRRDFIFVVFLRNDVFELMVSGTPDKGKAAVIRIDWTDRVKLKQVIHLRLQASLVGPSRGFSEIWDRFFIPAVNGRDTFEYFADHCLMRPRFLIAIIENAIANAINRRHERVQEEDCVDAVRQHSNSILNDFGYEIRDVSGASEKVLHSLAGTTEYVTKDEVLERFEKAKIIDAKDNEKLFQYMLWYGVLGVVNEKNVECFIYDFDYNMNRLQAEIDTQKSEPLFVFNPALHVALEAKGPLRGP
jgi:hypothetical protein